ncbi:MAG TPA: hypothetical protein ENJ18_03415, partial [Nannocystis exedens]|nr:hypothetical protein [Nannocystis exedens]
MRARHLFAPCLAIAAALFVAPTPASAFSTRLHMVLANKVRAALIDAGDGSIALRFGEHSVVLDPDDAAAIIDNPLAFR